jgi:Fe-S-cluster containining protein
LEKRRELDVNSAMARLQTVLRPLTSQPECDTCRLCEEHVGLVYLLGDEAPISRRHSLPVITSVKGAQYLSHTHNGLCVAFEAGAGRCQIYADRPLACRIYPLDLMCFKGVFWWVIYIECPIAQRFMHDRQMEVFIGITAALEKTFSKEYFQHWMKTERSTEDIEAFTFEELKVAKLRPFGGPINTL